MEAQLHQRRKIGMLLIELHGQAVYLLNSEDHRQYLFTLPPHADHVHVEQWVARSDSVEEFLEAMVLEELLPVEDLHRLVQVFSPLRRMWKHLRGLCQQEREIGPYPGYLLVGEGEYVRDSGQVILSRQQVQDAEQVWQANEAGDQTALHSLALCHVLQDMGLLVGRRLGLAFAASVHFGDWLASAITGWGAGHGNEEKVERLQQVASQVVYGSSRILGCAYLTPNWWEEYLAVIPAVIVALRERETV